MKSRNLGFAIFSALSLQTAGIQAYAHHRPAGPKAITVVTFNTTNTTNTTNTDDRYFVGNEALPIRTKSQEIAVPSLAQLRESTASLPEGRRKKKKQKIKNPSMNMMVGGSMMAAFVVIFTFLNMITVTLGKALFFTFIAKFLISVNWKSSESSSKKKHSSNGITVLMT